MLIEYLMEYVLVFFRNERSSRTRETTIGAWSSMNHHGYGTHNNHHGYGTHNNWRRSLKPPQLHVLTGPSTLTIDATTGTCENKLCQTQAPCCVLVLPQVSNFIHETIRWNLYFGQVVRFHGSANKPPKLLCDIIALAFRIRNGKPSMVDKLGVVFFRIRMKTNKLDVTFHMTYKCISIILRTREFCCISDK